MAILVFLTFCVRPVSAFDCCVCLLIIFISRIQMTPNNAHIFSIRNPLSTSTAKANGKLSNVVDVVVAIGSLIKPPWLVQCMPSVME